MSWKARGRLSLSLTLTGRPWPKLPMMATYTYRAMLALRPLVVDFIDTAMHSRDRQLILEAVEVGTLKQLRALEGSA